MHATAGQSRALDDLMDQASSALGATDYFEAQRLALKALERAHAIQDFERMARIVLPLQEARRQIRHLAADAGFSCVLRAHPAPSQPIQAGCYLFEPPAIGLDARNFRELAARRRVPVIVTAREPLTRAGTWPIVAVSTGPSMPVTFRTYVPPPGLPEGAAPDAPWFQGVNEKLGDVAIAKVDPKLPAAHQADDLLQNLDALPDHEKLHQALEAACRRAMGEPVPQLPRRRGHDNPFSF